MDDAVPTPWQNFVEVLLNPFALLQGTIEFALAWLFTRPWGAFFMFAPALIVALTASILVGVGWFVSTETLLERYSTLVQAELEPESPSADVASVAATEENKQADESEKNSESEESDALAVEGKRTNELIATETISPYAEMLLRRVLQLEKFNTRANYLVAAQMGRRGRVGQGRQMMRQLAPVDIRGFPPAHAWLAVDRLTREGIKSDEDRNELLHDLEIAATWSGTGPALLSVYADLLESVGRVGDAIAVLNTAVQSQPELQVKLANLAYRTNRPQSLEKASTDAKKRLREKFDAGEAQVIDYASLANLQLLDNEPDLAINTASQGLKLEPENPSLKRLLSEGLRMKYILTARSDSTGAKVNLGLLDAALKADPTNPAVTQEVARIVALGEQASPELNEALEKQLVGGQATAVTHVLMAMRKLKDGDIEAAIPHLELALRQAPNSPVVLNNLALALARTRPEQLQRSLELINGAVAANAGNAEYRDTQGEIRMLIGDIAGAIESYEAAIGIDGNRIGSREQLADAYEKFGLRDMAEAQRRAASKLKSVEPE